MTRARGARLAVAALTWAVLVTGCDAPRTDPAPSPVPRPPLRIGLAAPPLSFDPHLMNEFATFELLSNVMDGLVSLDADLRVRPALAQRWSSPDDHTWRFDLRENVTFHDGRPLTAEDVVASLHRAMRHPRTQFASYLSVVREVKALGPGGVEIVTRRPCRTLLNRLAFVLVVPRGAPEEIARPVGTGPYRLESRDGGRLTVLTAFERFWGGPPEVRTVLLSADGGPNRHLRLLSGDVDVLIDLTPEAAEAVRAHPGHRVVSERGPAVDVLAMRVDRPPFSDLRVRRAVDLALDRERLVQGVLGGHGRPATQLVSRDVFGYDPALPSRRPDLPEARRLLREAGHANGLEVELEHRGDASPPTEVARQLRQAGFRVKLVARPWHTLMDRLIKGEPVFWLTGFVSDSGDASDVLESSLHSRGPGFGETNHTGHRSPALDALIEEAAASSTRVSQQAALQACMRKTMAELPMIPLVERNAVYGVREDVTFEARADGRLYLRALRMR